MAFYLGLDLGTSGLKALLIDENQTIIASAHTEIHVSRPHQSWSEQQPQDWIKAAETAITQLKTEHGAAFKNVRGIGLSGQMHGAVLLDAQDQVLRPAILWNDTRSHAQAARLDSDPLFRALTGNIVFPGFTAPKLLWVKDNEPEIFARIKKILLPKDYLRLWLTGEHVSEMSDASGTSWLDVAQRKWSPSLLAATGLDESRMPRLVEGTDVSGTLRAELYRQWGMAPNVAVAGGAGDNAASACGIGTVNAGQAFASLGTSGVLFAANDSFLPRPDSAVHAFCHALPQTWHQMGVILSATDALNWYSTITGHEAAALTQELGDDLQAPSGVTFLPYLSGERTPHNDSLIRGSFTGLSHSDNRVALTQAVLEGVAFAFRDNLEALAKAGTKLESVMAIGGGSRSTYWLKALATALNMPVHLPADGDFGAAFGAARLGLIAAEKADALAICTAPQIIKTIEPDKKHHAAYEAAYQHYTALYQALKP
ncbi:xylulokinase [Pseudochrobactrum sp. sp1633]|uniref:xylulokinase n=1 Tax=Pseudochrobactrum sp. sp1633 TaxID=3036706 RepID=UPI0025A5ADA1|nr:xylulokinase [Pseudochrobactrum sp. sp1633]MDM8344422.1 xylulokinase [Pseudochrobactrum sp. sp1633]HWD14446.1 xylulokinase [Pseudochrobactrum sp.]